MEGGPPRFKRRFTSAVLLRYGHQEADRFRLRDDCPLWFAVPSDSTTDQLCNSCRASHSSDSPPYNPRHAPRGRLHVPGLGSIPFRSPLLGESLLISFPRGTEMFHFPRLSLSGLCVQPEVTPHYRCWVPPFGNPRIKGYSAPPRGLSQPFTSFIASWCQGIHRAPLLS